MTTTRHQDRPVKMKLLRVATVLSGLLSIFYVAGASTPAYATCGTSGNGNTSDASGSSYVAGTVWIKQPPGCLDFNVHHTVSNVCCSDYYAGYYKNSSGVWTRGASGYHFLSDGYHGDYVLISSVLTGVRCSVAARNSGLFAGVTVEY